MRNKMGNFVLDPLTGCDPEIGRWLAALEDCRERTLRAISHVNPAQLDEPTPFSKNTIGMMLYHLGAVEAQWVYVNMGQGEFPPEIAAHYPFFPWGEEKLAESSGRSLEDYLAGMRVVRAGLIDVYSKMTLDEFRGVVERRGWLGPYDLTPEGVLNHLMQHEAEHRGHIHAFNDALNGAGKD